MTPPLLHRLNPLAEAAARRVEVGPPARLGAPVGWRDDLREWLAGGFSAPRAAQRSTTPLDTPLARARSDFIDALVDVPAARSGDLATRIHAAHSIRELWHLRAEIFNLVARAFDQQAAGERLARLNRHFPTRSPRSGFGALDKLPR